MTTDRQLYCDGPGRDPGTECGLDVAGHGQGKCSTHLKQLQRNGSMTPIAEKVSPEERFILLANQLAEAETDADYKSARRAVIVQGRKLGDHELRETIRRALAEARSRGVRLGRPPKVQTKEVRRLYRLLKRTELVAGVLGVSARTIRRRLRA